MANKLVLSIMKNLTDRTGDEFIPAGVESATVNSYDDLLGDVRHSNQVTVEKKSYRSYSLEDLIQR